MTYVVLRDCPLRGRCLRSPHRQPRARPPGGAPGVLQAADESVWRPPVCSCPACFPRPWPGTAARGCLAAWGTSGLGQGLLGWQGERVSLSQSSSFPRAGPATADHSASPSRSHSQDDRLLVSESSRPCWQNSPGPCQEPQDGWGAREVAGGGLRPLLQFYTNGHQRQWN